MIVKAGIQGRESCSRAADLTLGFFCPLVTTATCFLQFACMCGNISNIFLLSSSTLAKQALSVPEGDCGDTSRAHSPWLGSLARGRHDTMVQEVYLRRKRGKKYQITNHTPTSPKPNNKKMKNEKKKI